MLLKFVHESFFPKRRSECCDACQAVRVQVEAALSLYQRLARKCLASGNIFWRWCRWLSQPPSDPSFTCFFEVVPTTQGDSTNHVMPGMVKAIFIFFDRERTFTKFKLAASLGVPPRISSVTYGATCSRSCSPSNHILIYSIAKALFSVLINVFFKPVDDECVGSNSLLNSTMA